MLLFELPGVLQNQQYLLILYRALFALAYYGLMRIGKLAKAPRQHSVRAKNVHMGMNKDKIMVVLYTSKTHGLESYPQKIKIQALSQYHSQLVTQKRHFCPFKLVRQFMMARGTYDEDDEHFFIFQDQTPTSADNVHTVLRNCLENLNLDPCLYDCHSFRAGRTCDMAKDGVKFSQLQATGRWKSSAIYRYLRTGPGMTY